MLKLLISTADWVFIFVVAAFAALICALTIIYFKVKGRAEYVPADEEEDEIDSGAEDGFIAATSEEPPQESCCEEERSDEADEAETSREEAQGASEEEGDAGEAKEQAVTCMDSIYIEAFPEEDGYRFYVKSEDGKVYGASEIYKSKAGALKGIKSLASYCDVEVCEEGDSTPCPKLELFSDGERYGYRLLAKNHAVKLSWADFPDEQSRNEAIEVIKNLPKLIEY